MQGAIFHQANVNLTVFPRVHGQTLSCTAMPQAGYFCHEVFPHMSPMHFFHLCVVPWVTQNTLVAWQTVFTLASRKRCSIQLWGIGGKTAGARAKSRGPWPTRLLMDGKLLAMSVCDVESKPCRDACEGWRTSASSTFALCHELPMGQGFKHFAANGKIPFPSWRRNQMQPSER